ncbi:DHH family phosphoesterase [Ferviditalea candida]|uniref:Bifunctional oligoribonuclease/PAP phosphatase NrnA n=1 Tax=Ferviditalea candida TaxID=3108399 RepID=A0ABU5ZGX4_9BACL|nr:bifunctional oligoribonuclease/PAP phosphatase NrnA [Paenibacillaceae bacterium T2]
MKENVRSSGWSYQEQLKAAGEFILQHDDFLVVSHIQPDGDAVSSTCAVGLLLGKLNKRYTMMNEGAIPDKFHMLDGSDRVIEYASAGPTETYQTVITVDCADFSRVGEVKNLFADQAALLNIDHHPTNDYFGSLQLIKEDAAATCEILYDLIEQLQVDWDKPLAECVYTGLLTDTGGFRYSNTSSKVMEIASRLLGYEVNGHLLAEQLLEKVSLSHILLLKKALHTLSFDKRNQIGYMIVTLEDMRDTQAKTDDFEGLVNYPINIDGVEVGLLFREVDADTVKCSLRSAGKVDVSKLAKEFGGGGHVRAAGTTLRMPLERAVESVIERVKKELP